MNPIAITPRAAPATANEARMGTAAGVAERIDELRSQADWYASLGDHDEAQRLRNEAAALAGSSL